MQNWGAPFILVDWLGVEVVVTAFAVAVALPIPTDDSPVMDSSLAERLAFLAGVAAPF